MNCSLCGKFIENPIDQYKCEECNEVFCPDCADISLKNEGTTPDDSRTICVHCKYGKDDDVTEEEIKGV